MTHPNLMILRPVKSPLSFIFPPQALRGSRSAPFSILTVCSARPNQSSKSLLLSCTSPKCPAHSSISLDISCKYRRSSLLYAGSQESKKYPWPFFGCIHLSFQSRDRKCKGFYCTFLEDLLEYTEDLSILFLGPLRFTKTLDFF